MRSRTVSAVVASSALPALAVAAWAGSSRYFRYRLLSAAPVPPPLPGICKATEFECDGLSGTVPFRLYQGADPSATPVVLCHGWGGSADSTWRSVLPRLDAPFVAVDLVGHGASTWAGPYSLEASAAGVLAATAAAGFDRPPVLVGHSMGGAVALTALRMAPEGTFSRLVMSATAAWWTTPRFSVTLAAAPWVLGAESPYLLRPLLDELNEFPDRQPELVWRYSLRPSRRVLAESAAALRRFDSRPWAAEVVPEDVTWLVPTGDRVVDPAVQRASARLCSATVVEVPAAPHSFFFDHPEPLLSAITSAPALPRSTNLAQSPVASSVGERPQKIARLRLRRPRAIPDPA